jgi:hypothetical protein
VEEGAGMTDRKKQLVCSDTRVEEQDFRSVCIVCDTQG